MTGELCQRVNKGWKSIIVPIVHRKSSPILPRPRSRTSRIMKAVFILFLSVCVTAWCVPAASFNEASEPVSNHLANTATLHRIVREIQPLQILEQLLSDITQLPGRALEELWRLIQSILSTVESTVRSLLDSIESLLDNLITSNNNGTSSDQRRRRSSNETPSLPNLLLNPFNDVQKIVTSPLPDLLLNPLNDVRKILHQLENTTSTEIGTVVDTIVRIAWNFFNTEVLPSVRHILERLESSNILPSSLQNLIQCLEAIYFLMQMAGYIS